MNGDIRSRKLWITVLALVVASLACSFGSPKATSTPHPTPIPVSSKAAGELQDVWATAVAGSKDGQVSVVMTEEQLTSAIAINLAQNTDSPIQDPQVILRDGKMTITANATVQGVKAPVEIITSAAPDKDGALKLSIDEAKFGVLPMPAVLLDSISATINELVSGQFGPQVTGVKITTVAIADGKMVLTGTSTK
jgi:hypothetical protein